MFRITDTLQKRLKREHPEMQSLFENAFHKLTAASPLERKHLLKPVYSNKFQSAKVKWTMRANHKYRLCIDRDDEGFIVRDFVGRGDQRYYR